jgi:hypothetical protein
MSARTLAIERVEAEDGALLPVLAAVVTVMVLDLVSIYLCKQDQETVRL